MSVNGSGIEGCSTFSASIANGVAADSAGRGKSVCSFMALSPSIKRINRKLLNINQQFDHRFRIAPGRYNGVGGLAKADLFKKGA